MRSVIALALLSSALGFGCTQKRDGRDICTSKAIGEETGAETISVNLLIPDYRMTGAEIANGGVFAIDPDCDFALNAFLSDDTVDNLIEGAKGFKLVHVPSGSKVANAELYIWRFRDASGEPRFFVEQVMSLAEPDRLPTFTDKKYFRRMPASR